MKEKIFILEDLPERQNAFKKKFQNWEIKLVDNVKEAIEILQDEKFDLIYLDHDLEGKCGVDINDPNCGSRVAEFLANIDFKGRVICGSLNPEGARNIMRILPNAEYKSGYWEMEII